MFRSHTCTFTRTARISLSVGCARKRHREDSKVRACAHGARASRARARHLVRAPCTYIQARCRGARVEHRTARCASALRASPWRGVAAENGQSRPVEQVKACAPARETWASDGSRTSEGGPRSLSTQRFWFSLTALPRAALDGVTEKTVSPGVWNR